MPTLQRGMIEAAAALVQNNPMMVAGVGTVAFGSIMYAVKAVPLHLWHTARRFATIELSLNSTQNGLFGEILTLLSIHRVAMFARLYTTNYAGHPVAGYGRSFAIWRGVPIMFSRGMVKDKLATQEELHVTFFTRDVKKMKVFLDEAREPEPDDKISIFQFFGHFSEACKKKKRPLDTVFANADTIERCVERIKWFKANEDWYVRRGLPYKLNILLQGEPGTGKTSLAFALASHFGANLCSIAQITSLDRCLPFAPMNSFILIEDVDMLSVSRETVVTIEATPGGGLRSRDVPASVVAPNELGSEMALSGLHVLINTLDGMATPHGLISIMTTNYPERLDPAVVRDGRIDLRVDVGRLERPAAQAMFDAFYGPGHVLPESCTSRTGATLQKIFIEEPDATHAMARLTNV